MRTRYTVMFVVLALCLPIILHGANILIIHPMNMKSHLAYLEPLAEGLTDRNHSVTVVTTGENSFNGNRMEVIRINDDNYMRLIWGEKDNFMSALILAHQFTQNNLKDFLGSHQMKELLASNRTFDAVISSTYLFYQSLAVVPHHFGALAIEFMPQGDHPYTSLYSGTQIRTKDGCSPDKSFLENFLQRAQNTLQLTVSFLYNYIIVLPRHEEIVRETYGPTPRLNQLLKEKSLILANGHPSLTTPRYVPFLQKDVAGLSIRPHYSVPEEYESFINKTTAGFVLLSWGSMFSSSDGQTGEIILEAMSNIPYQVIWKSSRANFSRPIPDNVMISSWIPQASLLADKRIKLFWTHGGFGGMVETVYNEVPVIVTPSSFDQPKNAAHMVTSGMGLVLSVNNLTVDSLTWTINEVINNPTYKQATMRASKELKSRLVSPMNETIFWIEHAITFKLRLPIQFNYSLYKFILENFDVYVLTLIFFAVTLLVLGGLLRLLLKASNGSAQSIRKLKGQ